MRLHQRYAGAVFDHLDGRGERLQRADDQTGLLRPGLVRTQHVERRTVQTCDDGVGDLLI